RREIDLDLELGRLLREDVTRDPIAQRILLPVHEMIGRSDLERIAQDRRARVRRRPQTDGLRAKIDRAVVFVVRDVVQCDVDRHGVRYSSSFFEQNTAGDRDQALTTGKGCLGSTSDPRGDCNVMAGLSRPSTTSFSLTKTV